MLLRAGSCLKLQLCVAALAAVGEVVVEWLGGVCAASSNLKLQQEPTYWRPKGAQFGINQLDSTRVPCRGLL